MPPTKETLLEALRRINYPGFNRDIVSAGMVREVIVEGGEVRVDLDPGNAGREVVEAVEREVRRVLEALPEVTRVRLRGGAAMQGSPALGVVSGGPGAPSAAASGGLDADLIPGVRHAIAVASGKGGVGKSTIAVNLAVGLARLGARVGLLDADIYGPSIPLMMGMRDARPKFDPVRHQLIPFERHGVRFMSLGFLVEADTAVIWRGPMVMKALEQLLRDVDWGDLDYLIVDMPPGTGDAQLTMSQRVSLAGAVVVSTPQDVALADAIKAVAMFRKVGVPLLGLVENMSWFECPHCSQRTPIFGSEGGRREASRLDVPFLGEVPLDAGIRSAGDAGTPVAAAEGATTDDPMAGAFLRLAERILEALPPDPRPPEESNGGGLFDRFRKTWRAGDA